MTITFIDLLLKCWILVDFLIKSEIQFEYNPNWIQLESRSFINILLYSKII